MRNLLEKLVAAVLSLFLILVVFGWASSLRYGARL